MSLWENEETSRERLLQRILIGVGAVAAIAVVVWVMHNAISLVQRPQNGVGFASADRNRRFMDSIDQTDGNTGSNSGSAPRTAALTASSPNRRSNGFAPTAPVYAPPHLPTGRPALGPMLSPDERMEGSQALFSLRQAQLAIKDFDQHSFWNTGTTSAVRPALTVRNDSNGGSVTPRTSNTASNESVDNATDALGAMVALYGHPDRFPEPVRNDVSLAATAMRGYLKITTEATMTSDPGDRQRLHADAQKRLTESDAALQRVESVLNTGQYAAGVAR